MRFRFLLVCWCACGAFSSGVSAQAADEPKPPATAAVRDSKPAGVDLYGDPLPDRAIARMGTIRFRERMGLKFAAFLSDNKTLLVVGGDHYLHYYETASGRHLEKRPIGDFYIHRTAMTPDRRLLAISGTSLNEANAELRNHVGVYDTLSGKEIFATRTTYFRGGLAISPDGGTLVLGDGPRYRILDVASGTELHDNRIAGSEGMASFSPDGKTLALGGVNAVFLWQWTTDLEPQYIDLKTPIGRRQPSSLAYSPDGKRLFVGMFGAEEVLVLDPAKGNVIDVLNSRLSILHYPKNLLFSPDGKWLVSTRNSDAAVAVLWNAHTLKLERTFNGSFGGASQLSLSPDGSLVLAANENWDTIDIFEVATGKRLHADAPAHEFAPSFVAFKDRDTLVSSGDDGTWRTWDTRTGRQKRVVSPRTIDAESDPAIEKRTPWIRAMAVSSDGRQVATSSLDETVRLWDSASGKQQFKLPGHGLSGGHRALVFSADGKRLASWGDDMRLAVYDTATGKSLLEQRLIPSGLEVRDPDSGGPLFVGTPSFSRDGTLFVLSALGSLHVFSVENGDEVKQFKMPPAHPASSVISPDNKFLLVSRQGPYTETVLPDGKVLSSQGENHILQVHSLQDGSLVKEIALAKAFPGPVTFSADGKYFAAGTRRHETAVRVFRSESFEEVTRIEKLSTAPKSLAFSRDNRLLAAGMEDATVLVWELPELTSP